MAQTAPTPISALPTAPSTSSPSTFAALADAFIAALATLRSETNAISTVNYNNAVDAYNNAVQVAADKATVAADKATTQGYMTTTDGYKVAAAASAASAAAMAGAFTGTSTTAWTPAVETKVFTTQTGEQYTAGVILILVSAGTPSAYGIGQVNSYDSGTGALSMNMQYVYGSGSHSDWNISLTGQKGDPGAPGAESLPTANAFGTVDAIQANFSPTITLTNNQKCCVISAGANTIVAPTFSPDGLTAHTIKCKGGVALSIGATGSAGNGMILIYHTSGTYWELINPVPEPLAAGAGMQITSAAGVTTITSLVADNSLLSNFLS